MALKARRSSQSTCCICPLSYLLTSLSKRSNSPLSFLGTLPGVVVGTLPSASFLGHSRSFCLPVLSCLLLLKRNMVAPPTISASSPDETSHTVNASCEREVRSLYLVLSVISSFQQYAGPEGSSLVLTGNPNGSPSMYSLHSTKSSGTFFSVNKICSAWRTRKASGRLMSQERKNRNSLPLPTIFR
uniref:Uncharacterized protein n=1 Tax=Arundo donax TaxID=35708 RepID=A0A0A9CMI8_ARUDO